MFGVVVTLLAVVLLAYFVIKNYYPPVILLVLALVSFPTRRSSDLVDRCLHGQPAGFCQDRHQLPRL